MAKQQSKDIVKKPKNDVAVGNFISDAVKMGYDGFENVDSSMLSIPFLKIAQAINPEAQKDHPSYIKGLDPGMLFNSVSNRIFGKKTRLIIIGFEHVFLRFGQEMGDFKGYYTQEEIEEKEKAGEYTKEGFLYVSSRTSKKKGKEEPEEKCIDTHTMYVLSADHPEEGVMIMPFKSTGLKHSRKWITKARAVRIDDGKGGKVSAPIFAGIWECSTLLNTNDDGSWYLLGDKKSCLINQVGTVLDKEFEHLQQPVLQAAQFVKSILDREIKVNMQGAAEKNAPEADDDFE
jgi:hypothetical protein